MGVRNVVQLFVLSIPPLLSAIENKKNKLMKLIAPYVNVNHKLGGAYNSSLVALTAADCDVEVRSFLLTMAVFVWK